MGKGGPNWNFGGAQGIKREACRSASVRTLKERERRTSALFYENMYSVEEARESKLIQYEKREGSL